MLSIGILSGTSMDALDFTLCEIKEEIKLLYHKQYPYEKKDFFEAVFGMCSKEELILADYELGIIFSEKLKAFLDEIKVIPDVVGFHGQTVFHLENGITKTLQIGEVSFLGNVVSSPIVYDFRRCDIAAGGVGAPLSPIIHYELFKRLKKKVAVLNLGGIANLTFIPSERFEDVIGFDIGPANKIMDMIARRAGLEYDKGGEIARKGRVNEKVFNSAIQYFSIKKKSLGEEVMHALKLFDIDDISSAMRTALEVSVHLIKNRVSEISPHILILTGGGVHNNFLVERIKEEVKTEILTMEDLGINSDAVEGMLFAYLAFLRISGIRINMKKITGAGEYLPGKIFQR